MDELKVYAVMSEYPEAMAIVTAHSDAEALAMGRAALGGETLEVLRVNLTVAPLPGLASVETEPMVVISMTAFE